MSSLPLAVHTVAQVRAIERYAIEQLGIPGYTLMMRAGEGALTALRSRWPATRNVVVCCGGGNNGGDGYVVARLAMLQRLRVRVIALMPPETLSGDAQRAWEDYVVAGGEIEPWSDDCLRDADVIIDAIFGTGLSRPVEAPLQQCIGIINDSGIPVLALDVPSGLNADTGRVMGAAVIAERTVAFVGLKQGYYVGEGVNHTGIVVFDSLDLPPSALASVAPVATRIDERALVQLLPRRRRTTHKGQQGNVLVIGGGPGMAGAARLAGEAALRVGAGLVTVATRPENVAAIVSDRPEIICRGVERPADLEPLLERADILAIGPGLGQDEWAAALFKRALEYDLPTVLDADALNLLARMPQRRARWILTPHPGEAGRLLGSSSSAVQEDRLGAVSALAEKFAGVVVLKGAGTLIASASDLPSICDQGNPGMASPGMGDVLTGVIAGIAAQTSDLANAARVGVLVHAMAGDMAARRGERGLLASDLFTYLPQCVNPAQRL